MWLNRVPTPSRRGSKFVVLILVVLSFVFYEIFRLQGTTNSVDGSDSVFKTASNRLQSINTILKAQLYGIDEHGGWSGEKIVPETQNTEPVDSSAATDGGSSTQNEVGQDQEEVHALKLSGHASDKVVGSGRSMRAAMVLTIRERKQVPLLLTTIKSYQDKFNSRYNYDWVVLCYHDITRQHYQAIMGLLSKESTVQFVDLTYSKRFLTYREGTDSSKVRASRSNLALPRILRRKSLVQSKHFTRFFAGHFYNMETIWKDYDYYWKVPLGSSLECEVDYDVFEYMSKNNIHYGWSLMQHDPEAFHPSLMSHVKNYVKDPSHKYIENLPAENSNINFVLNPEAVSAFERNEDEEWKFTSCSFNTDFELVDLSFFRSNQYKDFFNYIDSINGIYYEVWREEAIKTIALSLFLDKSQVKFFDDLVVHSPIDGMSNCPGNLDHYISHKCTCDPSLHNKSMSFSRSLSFKFQILPETTCFQHWLHSTDQKNPVEKDDAFVDSFRSIK